MTTVKNLETTSTGIDVTGKVTSGSGGLITTGNVESNADNSEFRCGADADFKISHSGSLNILRGDSPTVFRNAANNETLATFTPNGSVSIRYDNSTKFETTSVGVRVTGNVVPAADSTHDLGTNGVRWNAIYGDTISGNFYGNGSNITILNIVGDTSPQLGGDLQVMVMILTLQITISNIWFWV